MKSSLSMAVLSGILLTTAMIPPVLAAPHKPAKMTCEEFVVLDEAVKPKVVYWAEGFNSKGKPVDAIADIDETDRVIPMLVTECQKTPKASLLKKLEAIKKH